MTLHTKVLYDVRSKRAKIPKFIAGPFYLQNKLGGEKFQYP